MMKTRICQSGVWPIIRHCALTVALLAVFASIGIKAAHADSFLDEMVEFTGTVFYAEHKVPAVIIGVVRNGETSVRGFGERAGKGSQAPDGDTVMRIGSITKAFTGEVLAHLVAAKTVQLAQPLARSCPELAVNANADVGHIRLVDLATHAGGLPRDVHQPRAVKDQTPAITAETYADWLKRNPLLFKPGKAVHYSNFGFNLLALGLSRAANRPFPALIKYYITDPLRMKDTAFEVTGEQKRDFMQGHGLDGAALSDTPGSPALAGAGGLYSTANDLLKWMQWHLDRFGPEGVEARLLAHSLYLMRVGLATVSGMDESGHMDAMGLGWVAMMPQGNRPFILQKAGGFQRIFSYIAFAPTRGVAVFIAINKFDFAAAAAMAEVANDMIATLAPR